MSKLCKKLPKKHKFKVRKHNRCPLCGFNLCRLCFRLRALRGELPGVIKSSW
jgi:small subunit ribosomal protein S14